MLFHIIQDYEEVTVVRDNVTKEATLSVEGLGSKKSWSLYSGSSSENIDQDNAILTGVGNGKFAINVPQLERKIFGFQSKKINIFTADRHLPMTRGYNFRDIGGYKTKNGSYIKWGKIIRSDETHNLTDSDVEYLKSMKISTIVDFRHEREIVNAPDKRFQTGNNYTLTIAPREMFQVLTSTSAEETISLFKQFYQIMLLDAQHYSQFKEFFKILQQSKNVPLLYHCTAGKDRTGVATYLLLSALGVDEETIIQDYLLSNEYLKYKPPQYPGDNLKPANYAMKEYINAAINAIDFNYANVENYLKNVLEVNLSLLRELYTEDVSTLIESESNSLKVIAIVAGIVLLFLCAIFLITVMIDRAFKVPISTVDLEERQ